jgi:hypothetical protein
MAFLQTNLLACLPINLPSSKGCCRLIAMTASMVVGLASKVLHTHLQEDSGAPLLQGHPLLLVLAA